MCVSGIIAMHPAAAILHDVGNLSDYGNVHAEYRRTHPKHVYINRGDMLHVR